MFEAFRDFLRNIGAGPAESRKDPEDDLRVATAALLFHIVRADGVVTDDERIRLHEVLREEFALAPTRSTGSSLRGTRPTRRRWICIISPRS